ncbi:hypothetical protein P7K49_027508 [Saguinus oedipus]|uniref:Uncharacterized protein n=1 Tax=Saguinus oedipus TaxID=9490 RepID=A0ABQ9U9Q4_SAGOE|nr:hypothetical protein P7K49_027508 [Saguinus oedipus]
MLEGPSDKQLSAVVEGEVPPQREHERDRLGPAGRGTCGLWTLGGRGAAFVKGLKGDKERRGLAGGGRSAPDLEQTARGGCRPRGAEGLNLGQEAGLGQAGPHPLAGRPARGRLGRSPTPNAAEWGEGQVLQRLLYWELQLEMSDSAQEGLTMRRAQAVASSGKPSRGGTLQDGGQAVHGGSPTLTDGKGETWLGGDTPPGFAQCVGGNGSSSCPPKGKQVDGRIPPTGWEPLLHCGKGTAWQGQPLATADSVSPFGAASASLR